MQKTIQIGDISVSNDLPFVLFGGLNFLESRDLAFQVADAFIEATTKLCIPYVFKASYDKANRSSLKSERGPGLEKGLKILQEIKSTFNIPIITDVHLPSEVHNTAEVADVIQLPAFLSRQTDLITEMATTKAAINIKKAQFLAPHEMSNIIEKFTQLGNERLILCERGTCFGYNNLIVDMLGFKIMKKFNYPVIFDVTHSLQLPGARLLCADGRRNSVTELARSGLSQGLAGLFLEAHPDPDSAQCDGPCALRLDVLEPFLMQMKRLDDLIKSFEYIDTK
jgi:2-dehydro-3-deoxyphosphooctonate aldolase (KDO 8-P synthase)